jgi:hypothetical protein
VSPMTGERNSFDWGPTTPKGTQPPPKNFGEKFSLAVFSVHCDCLAVNVLSDMASICYFVRTAFASLVFLFSAFFHRATDKTAEPILMVDDSNDVFSHEGMPSGVTLSRDTGCERGSLKPSF